MHRTRIETKQQYTVTKHQAKKFREAIAHMDKHRKPDGLPEEFWQSQRSAMVSVMGDLELDILDYEERTRE